MASRAKFLPLRLHLQEIRSKGEISEYSRVTRLQNPPLDVSASSLHAHFAEVKC
jgi:hypothetical protein